MVAWSIFKDGLHHKHILFSILRVALIIGIYIAVNLVFLLS